MRTILFFAMTGFVSYFEAVANLGNHQYPLLFILIAFGSWVPFLLYYRGIARRREARRRRAYLQERCMRAYLHQNGYRY
jgi:hypothetical protein